MIFSHIKMFLTLFTWCLSCFLCGYFPDPLETRDKQNHLNHNGLGNNHTGSKKTPSKSVKVYFIENSCKYLSSDCPCIWMIDWLTDGLTVWLINWLANWWTTCSRNSEYRNKNKKCLLEDKNNGKYFWLVVAYGSWPLTRGGCSTEWFNCSFFMWGGHHICISLCMCNWEV